MEKDSYTRLNLYQKKGRAPDTFVDNIDSVITQNNLKDKVWDIKYIEPEIVYIVKSKGTISCPEFMNKEKLVTECGEIMPD